MFYARVIDGQITEIVPRPNWFMDDGNPVTDQWLKENENLHPVLEGTLPQIDQETQYYEDADWSQWSITDNGVVKKYNIVNIPFENIKQNYFNNVHSRRLAVETGGIIFTDSNGQELKIQTDRVSQSKIMASYQAVKDGLRQDNSLWKTIDGFVAISNDDMIALATTVLAFVQSCFDREKALTDEVESAQSIEELKNISIRTGWPANALYGKLNL